MGWYYAFKQSKRKTKIPQPLPRTRLSKQILDLDRVAESRDLKDPDGSISVTSVEGASIGAPAQACAVHNLHAATTIVKFLFRQEYITKVAFITLSMRYVPTKLTEQYATTYIFQILVRNGQNWCKQRKCITITISKKSMVQGKYKLRFRTKSKKITGNSQC